MVPRWLQLSNAQQRFHRSPFRASEAHKVSPDLPARRGQKATSVSQDRRERRERMVNRGPKERRVNRALRENREKKAKKVKLGLLGLPDPLGLPGLPDPSGLLGQVHHLLSHSLRHHHQKPRHCRKL